MPSRIARHDTETAELRDSGPSRDQRYTPLMPMTAAAKTVRSHDIEAPVIALIGCGAITEALHLPALARHPAIIAKAICIDPNLARARAMATKFGAAHAAERYQDVMAEIDGAIVAVPPHLHYPVAMDLLAANVHVLCEKPLAESGEQARGLIVKAKTTGTALCVNNYRRLYPSSIKVRDLIASGELGSVRHFEFLWGEQFDWPTASGAYFGVAAGGRGVLADKGSHILDLVCWWLGGKPEVVSYEDDSMGGTEAVAVLRFRIKECEGVVRLSWLSRYANTFEIRGDRATAVGGLFDWNTVDLKRPSGERQKLRLPSKAKVPQDLGSILLDNFLDVVRGRATPVVSGSDVLPSIELLDDCYSRRKRIDMPWYDAWQRVADR
ncbi:MAG TPA: Gfo/Idh/MocA family oxidoreductase [Gemmatimonadaceae bacterium]|nr:Gfo/Idh/MocA family oxidoreductase [Gemmatimonadaceae bacterium]